MKKSLTLFLFTSTLCLGLLTSYGQNKIYLGVKGGLSFPNLSSGSSNQNPLANGYKSFTGADIGLVSIFQVNTWFSIQPELNYSQQGGKHDGLQAIPNSNPPPTYLYANFNNAAHLNYLLIPVTARFDFSLTKKINLFFNAGAFAGFLLSAKAVASGSSYIYADEGGTIPVTPGPAPFDSKTDIKDHENTFNYGVVGAIGLSHEIPGGKIFVDGGFNYGFIRIQKDAADGTNFTGAATVHIGYLYSIK